MFGVGINWEGHGVSLFTRIRRVQKEQLGVKGGSQTLWTCITENVHPICPPSLEFGSIWAKVLY